MKRFLLSLSVVAFLQADVHAQVYGNPLYTWDFANGIPAGWEQGVISANNTAYWEYRGPNTTPNNTVGGRGSCAALAQPISSPTADNGFVIFDSNYWDNDSLGCNLQDVGTGPDPGPHQAWLITNPIDLSSAIGAVLTFQQQFRHYTSTTKVQISVDGGTTWTDILNNPSTESAQSQWASVNISTFTQGESNVRFKFIFNGLYYWWILDDITVYVPNPNDIQLLTVKYTNHQGIGSSLPYNDMAYDQYPLVMIPPFNFKATAQNIGANQQTGVSLNTKIIKNNTTQVYNNNTSAIVMASGQSNTFSVAPAYTPPAQVGDYEIFYTINQTQVDDNLLNNKDSLDYTIATYTYARDEGPMENAFVPAASYQDYIFEAGNYFQSRNWGRICHSIGVGIAEGTQPGAQIKGVIYKDDLETIWAETDVYTVNYADINEVGEERIVNIPLIDDLFLFTDSIYLVMVQQVDAQQPLAIARSGDAPEEMSILRYPEINALFYFLKTPVVRMNIFAQADIPGCTDVNAMNYTAGNSINDGTCLYPGCANENADNFNPSANFDNGTCLLGGCNDPLADNYDPLATYNNNTCQYIGCTDPIASNYDPIAIDDDGSCLYEYAVFTTNITGGCAPLVVNITNQTDLSPNGICLFTVNGDVISTDCTEEFTYTFNYSGNYDLTYTYVLNGETTTATINIDVLPSASISGLVYNNINHTVSCTSCTGSSYQWLLDDVQISGAIANSINTFIDGTYQNGYYQLQAFSSNGCNATSNEIFVLQPYYTLSANNGCTPWEVTLNNLTDPVDGLICTLNFGDGTLIGNPAETVTHLYTEGGNYSITLQCGNSNGAGNYNTAVSVDETTLPIVQQNGDVVECTNCAELLAVMWNINGTIFTGNGPYPAESGSYIVSGTNVNGCLGTTEIVVNDVHEINVVPFRIFPNPTSDNIFIENGVNTSYTIAIADAVGNVVESRNVMHTTRYSLDLSHLAAGSYTVVITEGATSYHTKLIVVN